MIKGFVKGQSELIIRKKFTDVGPDPFYLIGYRDPCIFLKRDFAIHTEPAGGIALKGHDKEPWYDYMFYSMDVLYSGPDFAEEAAFSTIKVLKPEYQTGDLYITFRWIADYVSQEMMNRFDQSINQMTDSILTTMDGNVVVDESGNLVVQGEVYPGYRQEL